MFQPNYKILLKKENFHSDSTVCLGSQLITIVNFLQTILPPHIWYGADIEAIDTRVPSKLHLNSFSLREIGADLSLIQICSKINQFLSGIFLAINIQQYPSKGIERLEIGTEDEQFRSLAINGVIIEIRAVDTSFFELYSEEENIVKKLSLKFNAEIIKT